MTDTHKWYDAHLEEYQKVAYVDSKNEYERLYKLRNKLYTKLEEKITDIHLNTDLNNSLPGTLNISFRYVEAESIIMNLDFAGIAVSSGSACTSDSLEPSHVLKAINLELILCQSAVRFSLGRFNTESEVDYVCEVLPPIIEKLRKISPLYKDKQ